MDLLSAFILGVVEGITEFLPISSTGHLILANHLLGLSESDFVKSFDIAIQLGAILAIVALYPTRLLLDRPTQIRVVVAFIPTAILGALFYGMIKSTLLGSVAIVLATLAIGGAALIVLERFWRPSVRHSITDIPLTKAALIGVSQAIAFIPGVSRSAATALGAMALGLSRKDAIEFSFFLAVPTMAAATGLDLLSSWKSFAMADIAALSVGFVTSFVVAIIAVRWLVRFVATHSFEAFGWYRIAIAILGALILL
jgi:undecaprenyl-diphosphatase